MSDDELIEAMHEAMYDDGCPGAVDSMHAVLAVVRAHDSASPTALANSGPKERQEAFDALKEELDDALAELAALRAERKKLLGCRDDLREIAEAINRLTD